MTNDTQIILLLVIGDAYLRAREYASEMLADNDVRIISAWDKHLMSLVNW